MGLVARNTLDQFDIGRRKTQQPFPPGTRHHQGFDAEAASAKIDLVAEGQIEV